MKCNRCGKENPAEIHTCTPPLAIALADELDRFGTVIEHHTCAAELRRLHAENEALRTALQDISAYYPNSWASDTARAALTRAGEVK